MPPAKGGGSMAGSPQPVAVLGSTEPPGLLASAPMGCALEGRGPAAQFWSQLLSCGALSLDEVWVSTCRSKGSSEPVPTVLDWTKPRAAPAPSPSQAALSYRCSPRVSWMGLLVTGQESAWVSAMKMASGPAPTAPDEAADLGWLFCLQT